jgi:hypothetical protein
MVIPPITIQDLSILLAASAVLLLITAEILPYIFGEKTFVSDLRKLRNLAIILGMLFVVTIVITFFL